MSALYRINAYDCIQDYVDRSSVWRLSSNSRPYAYKLARDFVGHRYLVAVVKREGEVVRIYSQYKMLTAYLRGGMKIEDLPLLVSLSGWGLEHYVADRLVKGV